MKHFERIERRLSGKMSSEEAEAFDQEMAENEELARNFEQQRLEEGLLDLSIEEDLLAKIKTIREEQSSGEEEGHRAKVVGIRSWRRILSIAAGLAVLVAAYFIFQNDDATVSPLALAQETYRNAPPNFSGAKAIGNDQQAEERNRQLLLSSSKEKVKSAIAYFESQKDTSAEAAYYLGHGYWNTGEYRKALLNFEYFLKNTDENNRLISNAEFYKSLALLAAGRVGDARSFIAKKIGGHPFQKQWEALLDRI